MKELRPKKGDMAKFTEEMAPADRYVQRWARVICSRRKDNTVDLSYPKNHRLTPMIGVSSNDLVFKRGDLVFTVPTY